MAAHQGALYQGALYQGALYQGALYQGALYQVHGPRPDGRQARGMGRAPGTRAAVRGRGRAIFGPGRCCCDLRPVFAIEIALDNLAPGPRTGPLVSKIDSLG